MFARKSVCFSNSGLQESSKEQSVRSSQRQVDSLFFVSSSSRQNLEKRSSFIDKYLTASQDQLNMAPQGNPDIKSSQTLEGSQISQPTSKLNPSQRHQKQQRLMTEPDIQSSWESPRTIDSNSYEQIKKTTTGSKNNLPQIYLGNQQNFNSKSIFTQPSGNQFQQQQQNQAPLSSNLYQLQRPSDHVSPSQLFQQPTVSQLLTPLGNPQVIEEDQQLFLRRARKIKGSSFSVEKSIQSPRVAITLAKKEHLNPISNDSVFNSQTNPLTQEDNIFKSNPVGSHVKNISYFPSKFKSIVEVELNQHQSQSNHIFKQLQFAPKQKEFFLELQNPKISASPLDLLKKQPIKGVLKHSPRVLSTQLPQLSKAPKQQLPQFNNPPQGSDSKIQFLDTDVSEPDLDKLLAQNSQEPQNNQIKHVLRNGRIIKQIKLTSPMHLMPSGTSSYPIEKPFNISYVKTTI